jgi:hypothetical protein
MNCCIRVSSSRQLTNGKGNTSAVYPLAAKTPCATSATVGDTHWPDLQTSLSKNANENNANTKSNTSSRPQCLLVKGLRF